MPRIVNFEGKSQSFPDDATDAEISAVLNAIPATNTAQSPKARTWTDMAVDALPAAGAAVGGTVGGIGGTAFGMGFGGVPGAAAGAGLGGATGEAAKQLLNRLRGADAPATSGEAAAAIGKQGAIDAATTGAMGAAIPRAATTLMDFGTSPTATKTGATIGKFLGATVPTIASTIEAGPLGTIAGLATAYKTAWAGGKAGWFTTKLMQDAARPISTLLSKATGATEAAITESLSGATVGEAVKLLIGAGVPEDKALLTVIGAQSQSAKK